MSILEQFATGFALNYLMFSREAVERKIAEAAPLRGVAMEPELGKEGHRRHMYPHSLLHYATSQLWKR